MRWRGRRASANIDDRRRVGGRGMALGGSSIIIVGIIYVLLGGNPAHLIQFFLSQQGGTAMVGGSPGPTSPAEEEAAQFVAVVLADTEDVWNSRFQQMGRTYQEPTLVMFSRSVGSACGFASSASGPFYCPGDHKVYLDLSFFDDLHKRFGASGDFAQAYVIAHEVGHHVQNLLGTTERVQRMRSRLSDEEYNRQSVMLELQADFYAGLWAHHAQRMADILEPGDIEEAIRAASAIGDDRIQMKTQGHVVPDSFTHGTSEQRIRWFKKGFESGRIEDGDTFNAPSL